MKVKLSRAQIFLLLWMVEKDRVVSGAGICTTNRIPCLIELPDGTRIDEPNGVSMAAVVGLVRRGLANRSGIGGSFITITDSGRVALRGASDVIVEMAREQVAEQARRNADPRE